MICVGSWCLITIGVPWLAFISKRLFKIYPERLRTQKRYSLRQGLDRRMPSMDRENGVRVLVAEDDLLVGELIQAQLEELGYRVAGKAVDTQQVVELAQHLQPEVILMDIGMPDTDGIHATQRIQARCPTPVVVLTAYETPELVKRASAAGVGAYLVKPPRTRD